MDQKQVYNNLKNRIVFLDYHPGKQLREKKLQQEFGIGRTPLREVFIKLETEGLIETVPNSGTYVTTVSFQNLRDTFEVRGYLIGLAGKLAAQRINPPQLTTLRELITKLDEEQDPKKIMKLDSRIHTIVNQATQNEILTECLSRLRQQAVRIWVFPHDKSFLHSFSNEFSELAQALKNGEESKSKKILQDHIKNFIHQIKDQLFSA